MLSRISRVSTTVLSLVSLAACSASSTRDRDNGDPSGQAGESNTIVDPPPGVGGVGGGFTAIPDAGEPVNECGGQTFPLERKPAKLLLVLDRSGSMQDPPDGASTSTSKWDLTVPAVNQVITETDAQAAWGLKTFPEAMPCQVTATIDVPIAATNAANVTGAITATIADGDGTPTGDAINAAVTYLQSLDAAGDTDQKYILLATDGEPSCVGGSETSQAESRPYATAAVSAAAAAGYHTFVVGVSTTKDTATQALNDMAIAGQEARPDPNPLATKYYLANTTDELVAALGAITGVVLDCRFALSSPPPNGERVGVRLGDERVPPEFWDFSSADKMTVEVTGEWCDRIKNGASDSVRIIFGCPEDPIR